MQRTVSAVLLVAWVSGCGDTERPPGSDAGLEDAAANDADVADARVDLDANVEPDGGSDVDAGSDGGPPPDGGPTCGDDVADEGEDCDGTDLADATCVSQGFDGGELACSTSCALDTSACFSCGDGAINGAEQCDGTELGGATCESEGFAGGTLACSSSCALDTSACFSCGDGAINGAEQCDGTELGGATCASEGFTAGTLGCSSTCVFDTTSCTACGNGVIEAGESCDGTLGGATCASEGFGSGPLACAASCAFDTSSCTTAAAPSAAGQIVISEIMQNPSAFADDQGEWFEVHNPGSSPLNLWGCRFSGSGGASDTFTVDENLVVPAGGYATFAITPTTSGPPGFTPDYFFPRGGFLLANASDGISLDCGGVTIDVVAYDGGATFPNPNGASMSLSPASFDATLNDSGFAWCEATSTIAGSTDRGTPGAANDVCVTYTVGFCRLQFPLVIDDMAGASTVVYGRVYAAGLTDQTGGTDPHPHMLAEVGYGADGSDPSAGGWTWVRASANTGYDPTSPSYEPNNDEYQATLTHPPAGVYDYAYRFSGDRGATWVYCDGGAGSSDGYQPSAAGQMTTMAGTGPTLVFFSEYIEGTSNNKAFELYNADTVAADLTSCSVRVYANGSATPTGTLDLTGALPSGGTRVYCNSSLDASVTTCDVRIAHAALNFNGDDALELFCAGVTLDVIGQIGVDPGTEWGTGAISTADATLQRDCTVTVGDANGFDPFDPVAQWVGLAVNTFTGLGARGCL